ncbi:MAG TPA: PRC-barrel domain-containing protein [Solirubrobacterales bacterium]
MDDLGHPVSYLVAKRGIPVFSRDGEKLGRVVRVLAAPEANMFDGILFDESWGPGGRRFVDAPEVGAIYERGVVLAIDAEAAAELPKRRP